jgi:hypothetical protein
MMPNASIAFKVELTLTVAKDGYETFVKHSSDHLSLN